MSEKRNAVADLAVCEATEKEFERQKNLGGWIDMCLPKDLADFINTAREALPYWIKRAQEAEAENARLNHLLDESEKQRAEIMEGLREIDAERDQALAEAEVLREVLKELIDLKSIKDTMGKTPDYIVRKTRA